MTVYFTSDLHFGHAKLANMRGYPSVEAHDAAIIETLRGELNKNSVLWILGDVSFTLGGLDALKSVPGRKRLVMGNHDNFPAEKYLEVFEKIDGAVFKYNMCMTHIPIHPQELFRAKLNIHGHIHDRAVTARLSDPQYLCVNWDFWSRPVSLGEIRLRIPEEV